MVNKRVKCSTWMQSQKWQNDLFRFQGKPFNIMVIQAYAPTSNAEEAEVEWFYENKVTYYHFYGYHKKNSIKGII